MGGYAWTALFLVLHKQLDAEVDTLLEGAAGFLIVYAWLIHFEPFVPEWRNGGVLGAGVLYTGLATLAVTVGLTIAGAILTSYVSIHLLLLAIGLAGSSWLFYKLLPRFESWLDSLLGLGNENGCGTLCCSGWAADVALMPISA